MTGGPLVRVNNLGRAFDVSKPWLERAIGRAPRQLVVAAAGVSFEIGRRETLALVGESGSGKSTVGKMVVGLVAPTTGEVFIDSVAMHGAAQAFARRQLRRRIQMVFQDPYASLNPRWRAFDIIAEPIHAFRLVRGRAEIRSRVDELLRMVGLAPADGSRYPHEFSGGQRQRIAVARALASDPEFVVCDEPTSALDVSVQAQILNLMRDLQDELGLTYLFISHNLSIVRHMAHRVGVMYFGRLVEMAPRAELFRSPRHPYTRMLLDAMPDLSMTGRRREPAEGEIPNPVNPPSGCSFHPRCPHVKDRCRLERPRPLAVNAGWVACHAVEEGRI